MTEKIDDRWLIRQWVIAELSAGEDPSPSTHLISSHWLQYDSYDYETQELPYRPDKEAADLVEQVWIVQPQLTRVALRPYYFERLQRATQYQHDLATIFQSRAWQAYERNRDTCTIGLHNKNVRAES